MNVTRERVRDAMRGILAKGIMVFPEWKTIVIPNNLDVGIKVWGYLDLFTRTFGFKIFRTEA